MTQWKDIPVAALKSIPYFTGETTTTPIEHIQDIADICSVHNITQDDVGVRLLATSLKGKALQWYRGLSSSSIHNWDGFGERLCNHFEDKSDHLSLVEQLTAIKRTPHEFMGDFNFRFHKTWNRILALVKPSPNHAFLYYLRALNSDIVVMIQSMGRASLPGAYNIAIRAENCLIQARKITPRPPMPLFPEAPTQQPTLAPIPMAPVGQPSTSSNELHEVKALLQNFSNELVTLKRQQA